MSGLEDSSNASDWYQTDPLALELSQLTEDEIALQKGTDLIRFDPVAIPRPKLVVTQNDYFDWPIATRIDDTIVVLFDRRRNHLGGNRNGVQKMNEDSGIRMVTISSDGGHSWSTPIDVISQAGAWPYSPFDGWGGGLGVHEGILYLALNQGVYHSQDKGKTWRLVCEEPDLIDVPKPWNRPGRMYSGINGGKVSTALWSPGMRITFDTKYGMTLWCTRGFKAQDRDGATNSDYGKFLCAVYSPDFGETWRYQEQALPKNIWINEITPLQFDGRLVFFLRSGQRYSKYAQGFSKTGWFPFDFAVTNVGPVFTMDTPDLIYNPRTQRLEATATFRNRSGLRPKRDSKRPMELRLYSIDPEDLAGRDSTWRYEGTLLRYKHEWGISDGMNPVGGVVDKESGVHRIYVWAGNGNDKSGIFQLTRSLDTPALKCYLADARGPESGE